MAMNKYGTGRIVASAHSYKTEKDGTILCQACSRIIFSSENLGEGGVCPYCHHNVNDVIDNDILRSDRLSDDDDDDDPIIALPC